MPIGITTIYKGEVLDSFEPPKNKVKFVLWGLSVYLLYTLFITGAFIHTKYQNAKERQLIQEAQILEDNIAQIDFIIEQYDNLEKEFKEWNGI